MVLLRKPESCETMTEFRVRLFRIRSGKKRKLTGSASGETGEVALQPSDVDNIQMVSRLIEKQDVWVFHGKLCKYDTRTGGVRNLYSV